jgi:transposase
MDAEIRKRLRWVELFLRVKNYSIVCLKCGISRPTLRKWVRRYQERGVEGLRSGSRRPKSSPAAKVLDHHRGWIRELRRRRLGSRRIQNELQRVHDFHASRTTIEKVLRAMDVKPLSKPRRPRNGGKRYARPIPGERIQMDTCKIAAGVYQYTAIDDCTRTRVLAIYPRRTATNSLLFLERVIEEMPFPTQAIQTDRGREFLRLLLPRKADGVWDQIPTDPAGLTAPKVERSQRTDLEEFYPTVDLKSPELAQLQDWQDHYNQSGRTPGPPPAVPALSRRSSCVSAALYPPLRFVQFTSSLRTFKGETMSVCRTN